MNESLSIPAMQREHLLKALNTSCCHIRAAKRLGIDGRTLYHMKKRYGVQWNSNLSRWEAAAKALPVLGLMICLVSCFPARHYDKSQVWKRIWSAPHDPCKIDSSQINKTR